MKKLLLANILLILVSCASVNKPCYKQQKHYFSKTVI